MAGPLAKKLRQRSTATERKLWSHLRDRKLASAKFRRQVPIGPYIVDFVCFEVGLVVELDGGQHARDASKDAARDAWLESEGYRVIRFWNNEVSENLDGVLESIHGNLGTNK